MKLSVSKRNLPNQKIDLGKDVLAFDYSETVFLIGRSKDCHVMLDDKQISREHVNIIHKNGKWFAEKTSSDNKCQLNGEELDQRLELENGDILNIGSFAIAVEKEESATVLTAIKKDEDNHSLVEPTSFSSDNSKDVGSVEKEIENINVLTPLSIDDNENSVVVAPVVSELVEAPIESPSDFQSFDENSEEIEDNFSFEEKNEIEPEALSLSDGQDEGALVTAEEENISYSLENIDNSIDNESTQVIQSFSTIQLELFGENVPYDKYVIEREKTYIGRDPSKCQIVLTDSEVSSVHAVITKNNVIVILEDLNSSNGTLLNGDRINKATLNHNDEFVIGGVTFTVKFKSDFLKEENQTLMAVDDDQVVEVEEIVEIPTEEGESLDALGGLVGNEPEEKSIIKRIWKDEQKRKKAIYALVLLAGAWFFLDGDESSKPTDSKKVKKNESKSSDKSSSNKSGKTLSEEEKRSFSARYEIGKNHFNNGRYREALDELNKIAAVDPQFNSNLQSLISMSKEGLKKIEELEKRRREEQELAEKKLKITELVEKAREYTKDRRVELANEVFNEIAKLDPENMEISKLRMELEDWQKEKSRKELDEVSKKKMRDDKVEKLKLGKSHFLQKEWFKAIGKLEDFMRIKDMDEDLLKEASEMLKTSKEELNSSVAPLQGKAKSLMEGQDLKGAYEVFQQILKIEPSNPEALNMIVEIRDQLSVKARKIYREAIISESLSLFQDAKEKFQEVQQISPVDSEYYKKASDKLKDYLE